MKTLKRLTLLMILALAFSGCDWEDDDFLGTWESYAYYDGWDEFELYNDERCSYSFYRDGSGRYTQIDPVTRRYYSTDFIWDEYSRGHLYLRHSDGEVEDFYYRFSRGDMLVSSSPSFHTYYVFSYRGNHRYYDYH